MSWSDDQVATLQTMWGQTGVTASIIGGRIGKTSNAVIGKANRLHLQPLNNNEVRHQPKVIVFSQRDAPTLLAAAIMDLLPFHCRWPMEYGFCCAPKTHRSYCAHHYYMSVE